MKTRQLPQRKKVLNSAFYQLRHKRGTKLGSGKGAHGKNALLEPIKSKDAFGTRDVVVRGKRITVKFRNALQPCEPTSVEKIKAGKALFFDPKSRTWFAKNHSKE